MKTSSTKRKIAETVAGAVIGGAIAGPAGAVAGGLVGSQASAHTPHVAKPRRTRAQSALDIDDPIVHAPLKRILVPLDFSPPSRRALRFAREWAIRFSSEIILLHVIEPTNTFGILGPEPIGPALESVSFHEAARAELEKLAKSEFPSAMSVSVQVRDGAAFDQIAIAAGELKADLVIIATHGRTGLSHALLGSTAERVVRHAPCPVLTLRRANISKVNSKARKTRNQRG